MSLTKLIQTKHLLKVRDVFQCFWNVIHLAVMHVIHKSCVLTLWQLDRGSLMTMYSAHRKSWDV